MSGDDAYEPGDPKRSDWARIDRLMARVDDER